MSTAEFNTLYESSVDAIKTGDVPEGVRQGILALLARIKGLADSGEMPVADAMELIKKAVVAAFLSSEEKVNVG